MACGRRLIETSRNRMLRRCAISIYESILTTYDFPAMLKLEQLAELLAQNRESASARVKEFSLAGRPFAFNTQPAIMGVINLSADSWYRESVCLTPGSALQRGRVLKEQGADIVDLGAESTLAHAARVDDAAQNRRLLQVIKALREA